MKAQQDWPLHPVSTARFTREPDYRLQLKIEGKIKNNHGSFFGESVPPGTVVRAAENPDLFAESHAFTFVFKHAWPGPFNMNFPENKGTLTFQPTTTAMSRKDQSAPTALTVFYFFNGLDRASFAYDRSLRVKARTTTTMSIDDAPFASHEQDSESGVFVQHLKIKSFDCYFGSNEPDQTRKDRTSFLIILGDFGFGYEFAFEFGRFCSFLTGVEIIPLGYRKFSDSLNVNSAEYWNVGREDLNIVQQVSPHPLIPTGMGNKERGNLTNQISNLFEQHLLLNDQFKLSVLYWHFIQFSYLPFDLQIHPLATALDLFKKSWFESSRSESKGRNLSDIQYAPVIKAMIPQLVASLGASEEAQSILRRIENANMMSETQKGRTLFRELGIDLTQAEEGLLGFRNRAIHGSHGSIQTQKRFLITGGFRSLLGRAILKLLSYDGMYVDYASLGFPCRHISEPVQLSDEE